MLTTTGSRRLQVGTIARRFGYGIAAAINGFLLVVVNNILEWDVVTILTDEWADVVPLVSLSLASAVVCSAVFIVYDAPVFKSACQIGMAVISMAATVRVYRVYPFDLSAYSFDWDVVVRGLLIVAMVWIGVSIVVELVKLGRRVFAS